MTEDQIYEELRKHTKEMLENGWFWCGAAKLEKGNPFFAMVKHVNFYVDELHSWYCRETHIVFDFEEDEPIAIDEKKRKVISGNNFKNDPYVPGLAAIDICMIAKILNVGSKMKSRRNN